MSAIVLNGESLRLEEIAAVALSRAAVSLAPEARRRLEAASAVVERIVAGDEQVYGVNTGFGHL